MIGQRKRERERQYRLAYEHKKRLRIIKKQHARARGGGKSHRD